MLFSASFLFLSFISGGFIYYATDVEYNLNQQIARGYISQNAVFFELHDPSRLRTGNTTILSDGVSVSSDWDNKGFKYVDLRPQAAEDSNYVINNEKLTNGLTKLEIMLSSGGNDYIAAVHKGELRGIYFNGKTIIPPITKGRFFTSDECLSREHLAVIGKAFQDLTFEMDNKTFIEYCGKKYEVLGVVGIADESSLDHLLFVNLGSMTPEEQIHGRLYVDGNTSMENIISEIDKNAIVLFGVHIDRLPIPQLYVDSVTGGLYLKTYLKVLLFILFIFLYISVIIQFFKQNIKKIIVLNICGISFSRGIIFITGRVFLFSILGLFVGGLIDITLINISYFTLPFNILYTLVLRFWLIGLVLIVMLVLLEGIGIKRIDIKEAIRVI